MVSDDGKEAKVLMEALGDDLAMLPTTIDKVNCSEPVGTPLLPISLKLLSTVVLRDDHEYTASSTGSAFIENLSGSAPIRFVILERSDIVIEVEAGSS
jgi:hypothetical protein